MTQILEITVSKITTQEQMTIVAGVTLVCLGSVDECVWDAEQHMMTIRAEVDEVEGYDHLFDIVIDGFKNYPVLKGIDVLCQFLKLDSQIDGNVH